jgi:hypothetical protein
MAPGVLDLRSPMGKIFESLGECSRERPAKDVCGEEDPCAFSTSRDASRCRSSLVRWSRLFSCDPCEAIPEPKRKAN